MKQLIDEFLTDLSRRGYSYNTIRTYRYSLEILKPYSINDITAADIMSNLSQDWEASTVSVRQAAIKAFFKWLMDNDIIDYNPASGLGGIRQKEALPRPIPKIDLDKIFAEVKNLKIGPRTYFWVLRDLGLRASEGINLDVEDIYWEKGQESVRVQGKGNRERLIPLSWDMGCTLPLKRLCNQQKIGPLFTTAQKERATYDWAYYWWSKLMEECNMDYTIHQLRHTAITKWVRSGMNILAVRRMAGHRLLSTTERYTQITTDDLRREIQKTSNS